MKGRDRFTTAEAAEIRSILRAKTRADRSDQKAFRDKLRKMGFYIADFVPIESGFRAADFDMLVRYGMIKVEDRI